MEKEDPEMKSTQVLIIYFDEMHQERNSFGQNSKYADIEVYRK